MNDNPVELGETHIRLNISETTAVGTELTRVNATDRDIGLNGKVNGIFSSLDRSFGRGLSRFGQIYFSISNGLPASSWMDYFRIGDASGM